MQCKDDNKLDNPVWYSLSESHNKFVIEYGTTKFYYPDYCPFGGFIKTRDTLSAADQYSSLASSFFIVGEKPKLSGLLSMGKELVCIQMVINEQIKREKNEEIMRLTQEHSHALYQLVNLVQPGYFKSKTFLLGEYFGIFKDGKLVAVTGERMKMNEFTEVSAVVTHPDHTRKGYAKQLVAHCVNNIFNQDKMPYLHVAENNAGAIRLYEKLGFKPRRKISFWNITK